MRFTLEIIVVALYVELTVQILAAIEKMTSQS